MSRRTPGVALALADLWRALMRDGQPEWMGDDVYDALIVAARNGALALYQALSAQRDQAQTAATLGISLSTLARWRRSFDVRDPPQE